MVVTNNLLFPFAARLVKFESSKFKKCSKHLKTTRNLFFELQKGCLNTQKSYLFSDIYRIGRFTWANVEHAATVRCAAGSPWICRRVDVSIAPQVG